MNCDTCKELILDSILEESDADDNIELRKHIDTCDACRMEYERIQSAVRELKPVAGEGLSRIEKLRLENGIYEARAGRLPGGNFRVVWLKRLTAIAAALFFFFLGYSIRAIVSDNRPFRDMASAGENIEEMVGLQLSRISGQRVSPRGLLLIAKGKKALEDYEFQK